MIWNKVFASTHWTYCTYVTYQSIAIIMTNPNWLCNAHSSCGPSAWRSRRRCSRRGCTWTFPPWGGWPWRALWGLRGRRSCRSSTRTSCPWEGRSGAPSPGGNGGSWSMSPNEEVWSLTSYMYSLMMRILDRLHFISSKSGDRENARKMKPPAPGFSIFIYFQHPPPRPL